MKKTRKETTLASIAESIEQLARSTANEFKSASTAYSSIAKQLKKHDTLLTDILDDTAVLKTVSFRLDQEVHTMKKDIKNINEAFEPLLVGYRIMQNELRSLDARILKIEKKTGVIK